MRLDGQGQDKGRAQASLLGEPFPSRSQECAINWPNPLSKEVFWAVVVTVTGRRGSSFLSWPFFFSLLLFFFFLISIVTAAPSRPVWSWGKWSVGPSR